MSIGLALCDGSLENGLKVFIHSFNLSIHLRIIRRGMLLRIPQIQIYLIHHLVLKVPSMVNDNILLDTKLGDNLIENEMCGCLIVDFDSGHSLFPFREVINNHYNMMIPPVKAGLKSIK